MSRVAHGRVLAGKIVVDGDPLPEGSQVSVWVEDADGFELDPESLKELSAADASIAKGEGLTVEQLMQRLARLHTP
jgi:hypothetical protein